MLRRILVLVAVGLAGASAAVAVLSVAVSVTGDAGPGRVEVRARWDTDGETQLELPPLGRIAADTHRGPLTMQASVQRLDVEELQSLLRGRDVTRRLRAEVEDGLEPLLRRFVLVALAAAAVAGAVTGAVVPRRRWTFMVVGAGAAVLVVGGLLVLTWRSYDTRAFEAAPRFEGPLERAPEVLRNVRRQVRSIDEVRGRIGALSSQVAELYGATTGGYRPLPGEVRILHVSDVHSNPVGVEITRRLAADFDVTAVVDTGDLTSFGLPVEARIGELVADFPVPYYLVPGNHDSNANRAALAALPGIDVLDGDIADIGGLTVLGFGDPTFTATNELDTAEANERKLLQAPLVARRSRRVRPDVLAVHDRRQASLPRLGAPVILAGHTHEREARLVGGALVLNVGSTGATGLGSFTVHAELPYEAQVLRFVGGDLRALDYVTLTGLGGSFQVERQRIDDLLAELAP